MHSGLGLTPGSLCSAAVGSVTCWGVTMPVPGSQIHFPAIRRGFQPALSLAAQQSTVLASAQLTSCLPQHQPLTFLLWPNPSVCLQGLQGLESSASPRTGE